MNEDDEEHCDEGIDREGPDPAEMDYSDEPDLEICPNCRKLITEEAHQCPHCGEYVTPSEAPMPRWAWIAIVIVIATFVALFVMHL